MGIDLQPILRKIRELENKIKELEEDNIESKKIKERKYTKYLSNLTDVELAQEYKNRRDEPYYYKRYKYDMVKDHINSRNPIYKL